ncbi:MAG: DUF3291 domain-containing protein [Actinomycetes bacterium]|uniref:Unannotated protein n=1 Tax=freshwater metagenome TaxID=449393 RepID=A0A6J6DPI9_9ZZZZ
MSRYRGAVTHHLAEFNIARLRAPLEATENAEFVSVLEAVNRIAEVTPGFVWRLTSDDERSASYVQVYDDPLLIVNYSVWTDLESLRHFTYRSGHGAYFKRRREWFEEGSSKLVCWWVPAGEIPSTDEAMRRLDRLATDGPSAAAFTFAHAFTPDGTPA